MEFLGNIGGVGIDLEIAKTLQRSLSKQGLKFLTSTKVMSASRDGGLIKVVTEDVKKPGTTQEVWHLDNETCMSTTDSFDSVIPH